MVSPKRGVFAELRRAWIAVVLAVPIVFATLAVRLQGERGPFWLGTNSDPSYVYLFSSLLLINGQAPYHIDHPGTPVQSAGALFLLGSAIGNSRAELTDSVLSNPERALNTILHGLFALTIGAVVASGILVFLRTRSLVMSVAAQLSLVLFVEGSKGTLYVTPEHLLVPLVSLLSGLLVVRYVLEVEEGQPEHFGPMDWIIGFLAGTALATKITFAPLLALPFLIRFRLRYAAWMGAAIAVGVILNLIPISTQIPRMLDFFGRITTHTGYLGGGGKGIVDPNVYWSQVRMLFEAAPLLLVIWGAAIATCVIGLVSGSTSSTSRSWALRLACVTVIQFAGVLFVAKHPNVHYMLPTWLSTSISLCLMVAIVRKAPAVAAKVIGYAAITVAIGIGCRWSHHQFGAMERVLHDARVSQLLGAKRVAEVTAGNRVAHYYRSASQEFALQFANGYSRGFFAARLQRIHEKSEVLFFNVFNARFETFADSRSPDSIYSEPRPLFFYGSGSIDEMPFGLQFPLPAGWRKSEVFREGQYVLHKVAPPDATETAPVPP